MQSHKWIPALLLAWVVRTAIDSLECPTSHRESHLGTTAGRRRHGRTLSGGADVYSQETVRTGDAGQADMQFHDSSNLSVGPKSSVRLDKFVYDPNKSAGTVAIQATRGTFRFVTGSQGTGAVQGQDSLWHPWRARLRNR